MVVSITLVPRPSLPPILDSFFVYLIMKLFLNMLYTVLWHTAFFISTQMHSGKIRAEHWEYKMLVRRHTARAAERIGRGQGKYKKWGPTKWIM